MTAAHASRSWLPKTPVYFIVTLCRSSPILVAVSYCFSQLCVSSEFCSNIETKVLGSVICVVNFVLHTADIVCNTSLSMENTELRRYRYTPVPSSCYYIEVDICSLCMKYCLPCYVRFTSWSQVNQMYQKHYDE